MNRLAEQLKRARQSAGLSQARLAVRAGVTQNHISKIENDHLQPTSTILTNLASATGHAVMLIPKTWVPAIESMIRGEDLDQPRFGPDKELDDEY